MKKANPFSTLSRFEWGLWLLSLTVVAGSYLLSNGDILSLLASLVGVTALIFMAKGDVLGQILTVVFSLLYGVVSLHMRYYGEMITYLGMSMPIAAAAAIEWLRHPYEGTREVEVARLSKGRLPVLIFGSVAVTVVFYFILAALGTARLIVSTVSVTTSFAAAYLTYCRSPWYALAYAANDVVLMILWILAAIEDITYLPMLACFTMFLANDLYAFINWRRIQRRQGEN